MFNRYIMVLAMALFMGLPALAIAQTSATTSLTLQATVATESAFGTVGEAFVLDGTRSTDDGTIKTYTWTQTSGPFKFTLASGAKISITPPTAGTYVFELKATDRAGDSTIVKKVKVEFKPEYIVQHNETDLDFATKPATPTKESDEKGGTEDINIGVGELQGSSTTPSTPGSITGTPQEAEADYFLKLDGIDGEAKKGKVEMSWKVEEGEKLTPVFLELDGVPGESTDDEAAGSANDRLQNAGPTNGWPSGGVFVASGDVNGLTAEQKLAVLATIKSAEQVQSELDLQNFAVGIMLADEQPAETLSLNYEEIKFTYNMPAKLFGFIPARYKAEVSLDKGNNENWDFGGVKVKFPWYSFLMRKGTSAQELTLALQQEAEAKKKGNVEYSWKVEEGTKLEQTGIEPDEIDFMGGSDEEANQGGPALLEIGGVEGEEGDEKNNDWINLSSWSQMAHTISTISNVLKTKHDTVKNSIGNIR